jgi:hypothetical protein
MSLRKAQPYLKSENRGSKEVLNYNMNLIKSKAKTNSPFHQFKLFTRDLIISPFSLAPRSSRVRVR